MKIVLSLLIMLSAQSVFAAGGGHGDDHIPVTMVILQAVNVGAFVAILYFLLNGKIKIFYKERASNFEAALKKAVVAREEAVEQKKKIEARLVQLEASSETTILKAKEEAQALKEKIIGEAKEAARKIEEEALHKSQNEIERAKRELREELLNSSLEAARTLVANNIADGDQKRLKSEFVGKIQAVQQ